MAACGWCRERMPPLVDHVDTFGEDNTDPRPDGAGCRRGRHRAGAAEAGAAVAAPPAGGARVGPEQVRQAAGRLRHPELHHPAVEQVIGKIWVQTARGTDFGGHHTEAPRTTAEMAPEDIAFRDMTNDELSKIFYAGAAKGKYQDTDMTDHLDIAATAAGFTIDANPRMPRAVSRTGPDRWMMR